MSGTKTVEVKDSKTFSQETRAHALVEALPYIQRFAGTVVLVKMGGNALIDEDLFNRFAEDIVLLRSVGIMPVVVHGGGPQIGKYLQEIGKESVFIDGLRVTDSETLTAVREVLVHQVGKKIVDTINGYGGVAIGISGEDDDLLTGRLHPVLHLDQFDLQWELLIVVFCQLHALGVRVQPTPEEFSSEFS